jgi:hypothetical protein
MKVELLWNDSNKQDSLISESVTAIRTNLHLAREQLENMTHAWSRRPYVWPQFMTTIKESGRIPPHTTGKHHSFIGVFKFIGIDEYIQIIFIGPETDEYKLIFISVDQELMNIWGRKLDGTGLPSVRLPRDTSTGIRGWPIHYPDLHPGGMVRYHPTRRPSNVLSLWDPINLVCASI